MLSKNITALRNQKGISQERLALELSMGELEITRSAIGAYEEGRNEPSCFTLKQLANFFDIQTIDELVFSDLVKPL